MVLYQRSDIELLLGVRIFDRSESVWHLAGEIRSFYGDRELVELVELVCAANILLKYPP